MKIHLPKSLRTALLACMTVFSPLSTTLASASAAIGAVTCTLLGTPVHAAEITYNDSSARSDMVNSTTDDSIIMDMTGDSATKNMHLGASFICNAASIHVENWIIDNANSNACFIFNSSITGSGDIVDGWSGTAVNEYYFTGDMSGFSGNIDAYNSFALNFGGHDVVYTNVATPSTVLAEAQTVATSGNSGFGAASGTGWISSVSSRPVTYNYTERASVLNSSITLLGAGTLNFTGGASYDLKSDVSMLGQLTVTGGSSLNFAGDDAGNHSLVAGSLALGDDSAGSALSVEANQNFTISGASVLASGSLIHNEGTLSFNGAVTLSGTGAVSIANTAMLQLGLNGSITVGEGQSLSLAGSITLSNQGQLINNGSLLLTDDFVFDISNVLADVWTYDEDSQRYTLQLITGDVGYDFSNFTLANLAGYDINVMEDFIFHADGSISFVYAEKALFFAGGNLVWREGGAGFSNGSGSPVGFKNGDIANFTTAAAEVSLGSDVMATTVNVTSDATLSLSGNGYQLDCADIILLGNSSLVLKDDVLSADSRLSAHSTSTSSIIFAANDASTAFNYSEQLQDYIGAVAVQSGVVTFSGDDSFNFASVHVSGGTLIAEADLTSGSISVSGGEFIAKVDLDASSISVSGGSFIAEADLATTSITVSGGSASFAGGLNSSTILTIAGDDAHVNFASDNSLAKILVSNSDAISSSSITLEDNVQITVAGGANSSASGFYYRGSNGSVAGYDINLGTGSVLSDNVKLWMGTNAININGEGRYEVSGLLMGYTNVNTNVQLNIGTGSTFEIVGTGESDGSGNSFNMGGANNPSMEVNVNGTFIINSQIAHAAGQDATINVNEGGIFVLNAGFKAYNYNDDASSLTIAVATGGELKLGNQSNDTDYSNEMLVSMADGTTLSSNGVDEITTIYHSISFEEGGSHTLSTATGSSLIMNSAVNNNGTLTLIGGGNFGFNSASSIQTLNVNGNSTLSLSAGVNLLATGGSINLGALASLNMAAGSSILGGNLNIADGSSLIYSAGVSGAALSTGNTITLTGSFVVGFDTQVVGAFEQILFTDVSLEQLLGFGLSENYYNGYVGGLAADILGSDGSWNLTEGSFLYVDANGNLILKNLADTSYWNGSDNGTWNDSNSNWLVSGEEGVYSADRKVVFAAGDGLDLSVTVEGSVSVSHMDVTADYSFDGGSISISDALTIGDNAQVSINSILNLGDADVTIGSGAHLSIAGDVTINGTLSSSGSLSANSLTLSTPSTLFLGDGSTITNSLTGVTDLSIAGSVSIGGNLSVSSIKGDGSLTLGAQHLSLSGTANVTGDITANSLSSITVVGTLSTTQSLITAKSLSSSTQLNFSISDSALLGLGLSSGDAYYLTDLESDFLGQALLNGASNYTVDDIIFAISTHNGNIRFSLTILGEDWVGTGDWNADGAWGEGVTPDSNSTLKLTGGGSGTVQLNGDQEVKHLYMEAEGGSYSLESGSNDSTLSADLLTVAAGELNLVDVDAQITQAVVGSAGMNAAEASLIVKENASLTADSLTVNTSFTNGSGNGLINDGGTITVAQLNAAGQNIWNSGEIHVGDGSVIGSVEGQGEVLITDGTVILDDMSSNGSLNITAGATASFTGDLTLPSLQNDGLLIVDGELYVGATLKRSILDLGSVQAGSLFVDADSITLSGDSSFGSVEAQGSIVITESVTMSIAGDSTIGLLDNNGLVTVTTGSLTLTEWQTNAGDIKATSLIVQAGGQFGALQAGTLTLGGLGTDAYFMSVESLAKGSQIDLAGLSLDIANDQYLLISSEADLAWKDFSFTQSSSDMLADIMSSQHKDIYLSAEDGNLSFTVTDSTGRTWNTSKDYYTTGADNTQVSVFVDGTNTIKSYSILDTVTNVNVNASTTISLVGVDRVGDESLKIQNMTGSTGKTLTIIGDGMDADLVTLKNTSLSFAKNNLVAKDVALSVECVESLVDGKLVTGQLNLSKLTLDGSSLSVQEGSSIVINQLMGDSDSLLSGTISLSGGSASSIYTGSYEDANISISSGIAFLKAETGLTVSGSGGIIALTGASKGSITAIATTGASVNLGDIAKGESFTLENASSMVGGTLSFNVDADALMGGSTSAIIKGSLKLTGTSIIVGESSSSSGSLNINNFDGTILTLVDAAYASGVDGSSVSFAGGLLGKYFTDASIVNGVIVGNINMNSYNDAALTENGLAGLNLMSKALIALNPQAEAADKKSVRSTSSNPDLASVLDSLDSYKDAGAYGTADALGAAVAGAGATSLGSALQGDVQRQLNSIRNRSQMMGVDPSIVNEYLPHMNMWMSAEAGSSKLTADGTQAGYSLNSSGGSVGMDFDFSDHLSVGVAFSALHGHLSVESVDSANGDLNTMYGSLFARVHHKRWTHSFVATFGSVDASLERSITTTNGSIRTMGDTDGSALGLMYEVGYTYALNEEASTCIQPIFNLSYTRSSISGYSERNSDIALTIGDQELSTLSISAGALLETVIGENMYNRASILSARAMLKFDAGDRASEADVTLTSNSGLTESIKGAEYGALGIEFGLGLTIPVTEDVGAIFADVSCEFRSGRSSVNATVGYRFGF